MSISGIHPGSQASLYSTTGLAHAPSAQAPLGSGNHHQQSLSATNASGPASTGPGPLVAGLKSFGKLLAMPALAIAGKVDAHRAAKAAVVAQAITARADLRADLGTVGQGSILNETLAVPGGHRTIEDLMTGPGGYLQSLQAGGTIPGMTVSCPETFCHASAAEVKTWIAMGEKIVKQLQTSGAPQPGASLTIDVPASGSYPAKQVSVPANLDTTRAITWYLTAQAIKDNHVAGSHPLTVGSGTFIHRDPGNAIATFIGNSDKTYGRFSSHFNHGRAIATNDNPGAQRFQASSVALGWKQSLQNGMEDMTGKFPGNGGTMLFHKLQDVNGEGRLFMKFESVGMPDALRDGNQKHGDVPGERLTTRQALNRCFHHGLNFVMPKLGKYLAEKFAEAKHPAPNKGEKLKDGMLGANQPAYSGLVERYKSSGTNPPLLTDAAIKAGTKGDYVVGSMLANLDKIENSLPPPANRSDVQIQDAIIIADLKSRIQDLGPTFGSIRSGAEIYTNASGQMANKTMADLF